LSLVLSWSKLLQLEYIKTISNQEKKMKIGTKLLFFAIVLTSLGTLKASEAEQREFEKIQAREQADPKFFQPGWLVQRVKAGDLYGIQREIAFDKFAIKSAENALKQAKGDSLLIIASTARDAAPRKDESKYLEISKFLWKNGADKSQADAQAVDWYMKHDETKYKNYKAYEPTK
jgi:hypothetical protein